MVKTNYYYNPIKNYFIELIVDGIEIMELHENNIIQELKIILLSLGVKENELEYLSFNINMDGVKYKIIPHNIITALWFIGLNPINKDLTHKNNSYEYNNVLYKFNSETNELNTIIVDEK